jgi:hypothetical protein
MSLSKFFLFFLKKVAAIYRYASLEAEINISVARLLILENEEVINSLCTTLVHIYIFW